MEKASKWDTNVWQRKSKWCQIRILQRTRHGCTKRTRNYRLSKQIETICREHTELDVRHEHLTLAALLASTRKA